MTTKPKAPAEISSDADELDDDALEAVTGGVGTAGGPNPAINATVEGRKAGKGQQELLIVKTTNVK